MSNTKFSIHKKKGNISVANEKTYSAFDNSLALAFSIPFSDKRSCSRADVSVNIQIQNFEAK